MQMQRKRKRQRLDTQYPLRLSRAQRAVLDAAAEAEGLELSEFLRLAGVERAARVTAARASAEVPT